MSIVTPKGTFYTANNVHWIRLANNRVKVQTYGGMPVKIVGFSWHTLSISSNEKIIQIVKGHHLSLSDHKISNQFQLTFSPKNASSRSSEERKHSSLNTQRLTTTSSSGRARFSSSSKSHLSQKSSKPNQIEHPITKMIASLYQMAQSPVEMEALLCYLLHYQHYNADLSKSEMDQFHYPYPVCAMQPHPGYTRTSSHLYHLILPFIKKNLFGFFGEAPEKFVDLSSSIAIDALQVFFPDQKPQIVHLSLKDLSNDLQRIVKNVSAKSVLFTFQFPSIDCTLLWGALLGSNGKWVWKKIDSLYGKEVISILGKVGATPDRLAANKFRAQDKKEVLNALHIFNQSVKPIDSSFEWHDKLEEMAKYSLDSSSTIYRDAILRWNECYFKKYGPDFALSLLSSEVIPWISQSGDLSQWIKGYQNLCEIIMLSLSASPEFCEKIDFESIYLRLFDPKNEFTSLTLSAGIFSYAMTSNFFILQHLLSKTSKKQPHIISVSQNYFETLQLLANVKGIQYASVESLSEIDLLPDILFCDIHPNNAAKETLFQNDVGNWIVDQLSNNPTHHLSLVLDLTLNHLSDPIVQKMVRQLRPLIEQGQLEVFVLQSLAKLMQLGADNFSGGSCIYLGSSKSLAPNFPKTLPEKGAFFSLLCSEFGDLTHEYFKRIRENTKFLYHKLQGKLFGFCPVRVTFNGDENTVYIALNFQLFLETFSLSNTVLDEIKKILLEAGFARKVPLTGRQSFGFPISNLTIAANAIRFSIGIHDQAVLKQQAKIIEDMGDILEDWVLNGEVNSSKTDLLEKLREGMNHRGGPNFVSAQSADRYEHKGEYSRFDRESPIPAVMAMVRAVKQGAVQSSPNADDDLTEVQQKNENVNHKNPKMGEIEGAFIETISRGRQEKVSLDKLFIILPALGDAPVRISHLDMLKQHKVFNRSKAYDFQLKLFDEEYPDHLLLQFTQRKPFLNYDDRINQLWEKGGIKEVVDFLNGLDYQNLPIREDYEEKPNDINPLYFPLLSVGKMAMESLDEKMLDKVMEIKNVESRDIILHQMFETLFEEKIREPEYGSRSAKIFLPLISSFPPFDLIHLNKRVENFKRAIESNPQLTKEIYPYLSILIPSIKIHYPSSSLSSAKNLTTLVSLSWIGKELKDFDPTLNKYMIELEENLVKDARESNPDLFTLISIYPFSQENREILQKKITSSLGIEIGESFTMGEEEDLVPELTKIFSNPDQRKFLDELFRAGNIKEKLIAFSHEGDCIDLFYSAFKWGFITQDEDLFAIALKAYQDQRSTIDTLFDLEDLPQFLNRSKKVQSQLLHELERGDNHPERSDELEEDLFS